MHLNPSAVVLDRAAIIAGDDRRRAPLRLARAEADRDLARRRRLLNRLVADRAAGEAAVARFAAERTATERGIAAARKLLNPAA